jgi:tRNA(Ile)-lysidine synthetase-like protein
MNLDMPKPGTYVIAVSGGVDSIALLHFLQNQPRLQLVVAHFDHGIRADSVQDRKFVQELAKRYGLPFVYDTAALGPTASEATARTARYAFLHRTVQASKAKGIITAHHQDDVIETAVLNILRGTGRKGLSALASTDAVVRPLLGVSKRELLAYATSHELLWREDSTNQDDSYLRNYVRHRLLPRFSDAERTKLLHIIDQNRTINTELDNLLESHLRLQSSDGALRRRNFCGLPHAVAKEVLASWLRANDMRSFDASMIERLVVAAKTGTAGQLYPVLGGAHLLIQKDTLVLRLVHR